MKGNHWYYLRNETTMVFRIRYILDQKVLELWSMIKRRSTCPTEWNINSLWKFCSRKNHIFLIFNGIKHLFFVNQILCSSPVDMSWRYFVPLPSQKLWLLISSEQSIKDPKLLYLKSAQFIVTETDFDILA